MKQVKQNAIMFFESLNSNNNELNELVDLILMTVLLKLQEKSSQTMEELLDIIIETLKEFEIDESMYKALISVILEKLLGTTNE